MSERFRKVPILEGAVAALQADTTIAAWAANIEYSTNAINADELKNVLASIGSQIIVRRGPVRRRQEGTCSERAEFLLGIIAIASDFTIDEKPSSADEMDEVEDDIRRVLDGNTSIYRTDDAWVEEIHWEEISEARPILWMDIIEAGFHTVITNFRVIIHQELRD